MTDGWTASPTWWTWIWVGSGSWWWTGKPGMLQSMGSQRVGHNWATELNWRHLTEPLFLLLRFPIPGVGWNISIFLCLHNQGHCHDWIAEVSHLFGECNSCVLMRTSDGLPWLGLSRGCLQNKSCVSKKYFLLSGSIRIKSLQPL